MRLSVLFASSLLFTSGLAMADGHKKGHDHGHASQKAHEHGVADMTVSIMKNQAMIEVTSPAYNLVGFGHQPKNEGQTQLIADKMRGIRSGTLVLFNDDAKCRLSGQHYTNPFIEQHDDHSHDHAHDHKESINKAKKQDKKAKHGNHKDVEFTYEYRCDMPEKIFQIDAHNLFDAWPNTKKLRVQWIKDKQQSSNVLTQKSQQLIFK